VVLALVAAACGGGDGLVEQAAEDAGTDAPISIDDLPTDVGNLPGVSGECEALLNLFISMGGVFLGGPVSALDPGTLGGLPPEIAADAILMSDTLREFSEGLQDLGIDIGDPNSLAAMSEAQQEAFSALTESLDNDAFNTASDNVSAYGEQQCENQFEGIGG
jgi:hypothetical protein